MPGTCAVRVISEFMSDDGFQDIQDNIPNAALFELFKFAVASVLEGERRKQLIATTVYYQKKIVKYLEAVGFKNAGTSENPSSGNDVTIWVLNT